jgi:hypothetical protein
MLIKANARLSKSQSREEGDNSVTFSDPRRSSRNSTIPFSRASCFVFLQVSDRVRSSHHRQSTLSPLDALSSGPDHSPGIWITDSDRPDGQIAFILSLNAYSPNFNRLCSPVWYQYRPVFVGFSIVQVTPSSLPPSQVIR